VYYVFLALAAYKPAQDAYSIPGNIPANNTSFGGIHLITSLE